MNIKKFFCAVIAAVMMISVCPAVSAVDMKIVYKAGSFSSSEIELMKIIERSIRDRDQTSIDISSYNISFDEFESLYGSVVFHHPEFYYVSMTSAYLTYDSKDHIKEYAPLFTHSEKSQAKMEKQIKAKADEILSGIDSKMTDAEKVLYIHDAIITCCDYYEGDNTAKGRSIYDVLVKGSSVCVGYSLTFLYFMDKLGIPCICVTNDDHIWNMVQINENWYHVDTTWDDMNSESPNFVIHDMVLLSEYGLDTRDQKHDRWDYGMTADSSKYDDFFWKDSYSSITYLDGYWYYNKLDGLYRYNFRTNKSERVVKNNEKWKDKNGTWRISFGKNMRYGNSIIYSTPTAVYRYTPSTGSNTCIAKPAMNSSYQIYDFTIDGSQLSLYTSDTYKQASKNIKTVSVSGKAANNPEVKTASKTSNSDKTGFALSSDKKGIHLSWKDKADAEQYYVYRYNKKTKKAVIVTKTIETEVILKHMDDDDNYLYAIRVRTSDGLGGYSAWLGV
ncbi:MAG: hypothetical protein ILP19_03485 [Oscillospiraceae bacterium]|nr:hypothetical protein [Oscillospiraceae bacterium]